MKKKMMNLLLLLLALFPAQAVWGKLVLPEEAEMLAKAFFQSASSDQAAREVLPNLTQVTPPQRGGRVSSATPAYYIFNKEDGKGFVVISAESETQSVLAYSLEGNFVPELWDQTVAPFFEVYEEQIEKLRNGEVEAEPVPKPVSDITPILLRTPNWDQSDPFFNSTYAPTYRGYSCLSGCVATAMAEVMQYWQWPVICMGYNSYTTSSYRIRLSRDFSQDTFNWDLMNGEIVSGTASSNEVSRLMRACGIAVNADYGPYETGAYDKRVAWALREYFFYTPPLWVLRQVGDFADWQSLMYFELLMGRPVICGGDSNPGGGHCFVLDGVDASGLFHYNLGWSGQNNGYYSDGNIGAGSGYRFTLTDFLVGIQPMWNTAGYKQYSPVGFSSKEILSSEIRQGEAFNLRIYNICLLNNATGSFKLRWEMRDKYGAYKSTVSAEVSGTISGPSSGFSYHTFSCTIPTNVKVEPGDRLWLYAKVGSGDWLPSVSYSEEYSTVLLMDEPSGVEEIKESRTGQSVNAEDSDAPIYDLYGRRLQEIPSSGFYIRNGKKYRAR